MFARFTGTIEELADVDVTQAPEEIARVLVEKFYPGCSFAEGVWSMEPGQVHPAHTDIQPPEWLTRIHVPLTTNDGVVFVMDDGTHRMRVGKAYRMNTLATHAVMNLGASERVHLVIDVRT